MPEFSFGKTVRSEEPVVRVDNLLEPGLYRFQLIVVDDENNESAPAELVVQVFEGKTPPPPPVPREEESAAPTRGRPKVRTRRPRRPRQPPPAS
jgi:hypothetical protein